MKLFCFFKQREKWDGIRIEGESRIEDDEIRNTEEKGQRERKSLPEESLQEKIEKHDRADGEYEIGICHLVRRPPEYLRRSEFEIIKNRPERKTGVPGLRSHERPRLPIEHVLHEERVTRLIGIEGHPIPEVIGTKKNPNDNNGEQYPVMHRHRLRPLADSFESMGHIREIIGRLIGGRRS
jgi:hypothetical protein